MTIFLIALILFFILELLYFKIADRFNIIDKPNQRSSHSQITLRGGGIIFPIALIAGVTIFEPSSWYLALGVFAIALVSFLDDVLTLNNKVRIATHIISVVLILFQILINQYDHLSLGFGVQLADFGFPSLLLLLCSLILTIGIINAYNFMDGINGITVLYSMVSVLSIYYIQKSLAIAVLDQNILLLLMASLLIFGFFNLRRKAKAFAGDVGSISIALILCFLILQLIVHTGNVKWILLLGVYGLDTVATIFCRIMRKENIFDAHRSHFYQYLANERKWKHLWVSIVYAVIQLVLNVFVFFVENAMLIALGFAILTAIYIFLRIKWEGKKRLFVKY